MNPLFNNNTPQLQDEVKITKVESATIPIKIKNYHFTTFYTIKFILFNLENIFNEPLVFFIECNGKFASILSEKVSLLPFKRFCDIHINKVVFV